MIYTSIEFALSFPHKTTNFVRRPSRPTSLYYQNSLWRSEKNIRAKMLLWTTRQRLSHHLSLSLLRNPINPTLNNVALLSYPNFWPKIPHHIIHICIIASLTVSEQDRSCVCSWSQIRVLSKFFICSRCDLLGFKSPLTLNDLSSSIINIWSSNSHHFLKIYLESTN